MSINPDQQLTVDYIGKVHTPYQEKFAIARQPGLVTAALGYVEIYDQQHAQQMLEGIEQYSHLWLIFAFNATQSQGWKPTVRPPRLGGNKKMGVLATRSTFRPNPVGMSAVKFNGLVKHNGKLMLEIQGMDLLNQTPIIDIKPYLPYSDAITQATSDQISVPAITNTVVFSEQVNEKLNSLKKHYMNLKELIKQVLAQDPRPAYKHKTTDDRVYGMTLYDLNIQWQMVTPTTANVIDITEIKDEN